jgi:hypothetical protein
VTVFSSYYYVLSTPIAERKLVVNNTLRRWLYLERAVENLEMLEKFVPSHPAVCRAICLDFYAPSGCARH